MSARWAADAVLILHLLFILWALFGGFAVWRWRWLMALHLPALAWGVWIELSHGVCPLTPLENALRIKAGQAGYPGGFIEHYLVALIYPAGLTPTLQWLLAAGLLAVNLLIYLGLWRRRRRASAAFRSPP
jgi:hypothetical protein